MKAAAKEPRTRRAKLLPGASVTQAMQMTGFSRPIREALISENRLAVVRFGSHRRIPLTAIQALIDEMGGFAPPPPEPRPAPAQSERRQRKVTGDVSSMDRPAKRRGRPKKAAQVAAE